MTDLPLENTKDDVLKKILGPNNESQWGPKQVHPFHCTKTWKHFSKIILSYTDIQLWDDMRVSKLSVITPKLLVPFASTY